jgi:GT2 family glycosyltransferase
MYISEVISYVARKLDRGKLKLSNLVTFESHHSSDVESESHLPLVSIIIHTRDKADLLRACLDSIARSTNYPNTEIIVVNNSSVEVETHKLFEELKSQGVKIIEFDDKFNYSKMSNLAADSARGQYLCFLNNDVETISPGWLGYMVEHAAKDYIGVVGAVLTYPDGKIQHMGIALGHTGVAGHPGRASDPATSVPQQCYEVSAVTFACALIETSKFRALNGLDEKFPSGFNDVDIAIRAISVGLRNVVCSKASLLHRESQTRPRSFSRKGFFQASKDVLTFLSKHRGRPTERFFTR